MGGIRFMRPVAIAGCVFGLLTFGVLSLKYGDFLLQWQPVPASFPGRTPLAYLSGLILLASGAGLLFSGFRRAAAIVACVWIASWVVLLHAPLAFAAESNVSLWLGLAECEAVALGLACLVQGGKSGSWGRVLILNFGICLFIFGISHFVYADFTAKMVPAWMPARWAIAYITGIIHTLNGLCLFLGYSTQLAATIEALMMTSFVALVHAPRVAATPYSRRELTMLAAAVLLTSAAWLFATMGAHRR